MKLQTASETISFGRELEEQAAKFCEDMAAKFPEKADVLNAFAKENRKFHAQIQRAYQSVITDAIEGCYAFNLESDNFQLDTEVPDKLADAVKKAVAVEEVLLNFYDVGAEQSMSLMADVPRNFKLVAKKRRARLEKLQALA